MKSIDLDSLPRYTKLELAVHQLDRAISLLLDEGDIVSSITLAGAAEEILGKLVEASGEKHSLKEFIEECLSCGNAIEEEWKAKDFADIANFYRNELKHFCEGEDISVSRECATEIIDRAIENLWRATGSQTQKIRRYMADAYI